MLYKSKAIEFGKLLIFCFPYARWSNYVHKTIGHAQEVIEIHGTLGGFSGEGNEAGNKPFHTYARTIQGNPALLIRVNDVLKMQWLYYCLKLKKLSDIARRKYRCSICKQNGHNCNTCPSAPNQ